MDIDYDKLEDREVVTCTVNYTQIRIIYIYNVKDLLELSNKSLSNTSPKHVESIECPLRYCKTEANIENVQNSKDCGTHAIFLKWRVKLNFK